MDSAMQGLMQDQPLLISSLLEHAVRVHPRAEIVSRLCEGTLHRSSYGAVALAAVGLLGRASVVVLAWPALVALVAAAARVAPGSMRACSAMALLVGMQALVALAV